MRDATIRDLRLELVLPHEARRAIAGGQRGTRLCRQTQLPLDSRAHLVRSGSLALPGRATPIQRGHMQDQHSSIAGTPYSRTKVASSPIVGVTPLYTGRLSA